MAKWLMKSEPDVFGYDHLEKKGAPEEWTGVRNYGARNHMRAMKSGEEVFFYHSNIGKEIVGIMTVAAESHPDSTAEEKNGKLLWDCVDVSAKRRLKRPVGLEEIKRTKGLEQMVLINNSRLSVQPVTEEEWKIVLELSETPA